MRIVVVAIIERDDRRILIGQRRKEDTSALKWEFPGGKIEEGETPEAALARELREELDAELKRAVEIGRARHQYKDRPEELEIRFYAAEIADRAVAPKAFEKVEWVLPKELGNYDFLAANVQILAQLATGKIKAREILDAIDGRAQGPKK